jgi:hypothetical protein
VRTSRHASPQRVDPSPQAKPHLPALHVGMPPAGAVHALLHAPQFATSLLTDTQDEPPQSWVPAAHDDVQEPLEQIWFAAHATPQAPQLAALVLVLRQAPEQGEKPALHWMPQALAAHVAWPFAGAGHALAQDPQCAASSRRTQTPPQSP